MATRKRKAGLIWKDEATSIVQKDIELAGEIWKRFYAHEMGVEWKPLENPLAENIAQMLISEHEVDQKKWEEVSKVRSAAGRLSRCGGYFDPQR